MAPPAAPLVSSTVVVPLTIPTGSPSSPIAGSLSILCIRGGTCSSSPSPSGGSVSSISGGAGPCGGSVSAGIVVKV